jgi:hypothetical protein
MSVEKQDYLEKCNQTKMSAVKHMKLKCAFCKKADCVRAKKAE